MPKPIKPTEKSKITPPPVRSEANTFVSPPPLLDDLLARVRNDPKIRFSEEEWARVPEDWRIQVTQLRKTLTSSSSFTPGSSSISGIFVPPIPVNGPTTVDGLLKAQINAPENPRIVNPLKKQGPDELTYSVINVENLFHPSDDPLTDDVEFTPLAKYTEEVMFRHMTNLGKVIRSINGGDGPDILGLVEVEDKRVCEILVERELPNRGYQVISIPGEDKRGVDVGLMTKLPFWEGSTPRLLLSDKVGGERGILRVELNDNGKKMVVYVNHWKSMREGEDKAASLNSEFARLLREDIANTEVSEPQSGFLVLGDFNTKLQKGRQDAMLELGVQAPNGAEADQSKLVDLTHTIPQRRAAGVDHILLAPGTDEHKNEPDFLMRVMAKGLSPINNSLITIRTPGRFFQGRDERKRINPEGVSDHLPLVGRIKRNALPDKVD